MYNPNEAIKLLNRALEAKHPRDCLSCIHSALAILEPEPTELTTLARRFLPPVEVFEHVDITDVSEQPGQLELICHKLCKEIDRLTAELAEGKHSTLKMLRLEINRLKAEIRDLKIALKADSERIGKIIKFQAELKAKDLIIKLIKNHAAINFDNHLLALIAEIEKDPEDFNKFLKGEW